MDILLEATPYVRLLKRLILGRGSLQAAAYQQNILCHEEKANIHPAVFLPNQIDRIIGVSEHSTKEAVIAATISTIATHAPTIAFHIKNAVLLDGAIFAGRYKHLVAKKSLFAETCSAPRQLKVAALCSSFVGTRYFGHWLKDDCLTWILAEKYGDPINIRRPPAPMHHMEQYQLYFGQTWVPTDRALIDELIVFQDFAQNSLKHERYVMLRNRLRKQFPSNGPRKFVYLRRGRSGSARVIRNEDEIIEALTKKGFVTIDVETDSLERILTTLANAKIVVSIEGSHINHCTFSIPEDSGLLVLQPPDRFVAIHRDWTQCLGIKFGFVVGRLSYAGYYFSSSEILLTTDLLLKSVEHKDMPFG